MRKLFFLIVLLLIPNFAYARNGSVAQANVGIFMFLALIIGGFFVKK